MTKRKLTKYEDDVRRNLRKSAEINPAQSPHDGIHTCSKGCKKPGCNRGLRDTIEEQDAQIVALKQDLLEQTAAVRHLRMERIHDLNHIGGLQEENADLRSQFANSEQENARLKAEAERLDALCRQLMSQHCDISCENIMLRKAGDAVVADLEYLTKSGWFNKCKSVRRWNAAKEGKPSV